MLTDTSHEIEVMQNDLWMQRSSSDRAKFMFGMFAMARRAMIASLPSGLSERELTEKIYFRTYGEKLPDDFFNDDE